MRIELFMPSTFEGDIPTDNSLILEECIHRFITIFGGCTVKEETGYYKSDKLGKVIKEKVNIVYVFIENMTEAKRRFFVITAKYVCRELKQECVLLVIDGIPEFIEA